MVQACPVRTPKPWALPTQPVTRGLLVAAGISVGMIETRLRTGELVRLRQGVYLAAAAWPDDPVARHLVLAHAEQVANPHAVLSHQSAALAWALPSPGRVSWHELPVSLTVPAGKGRRSRLTNAVHRAAWLPAEQVARDAGGYPVTSLARTAVDLATGLELPEALVILDAAARSLCAAFVTSPRRSDFANPRLVRAARESLRQAAPAQPASLLEAVDLADPGRESPAESLSAGHFEVSGLPRPLFQAPLATPMGTLYPDCLWPEQRLIGECDGAIKYTRADAYVQEKQREQVLRDLGFGMVRWLGREIMTEPWTVVHRVARALAA